MLMIRIFLVLMAASISAQAQQEQEVNINELPDLQYVDTDGDHDRGRLRGHDSRRRTRDGEVVQVQEETTASPSQGVVILNSNTNTNVNKADSVLQQPPTYVEASPLTDSRAEQLRKARQAAEVNTEQKIVEKLEVSRLKDERDRANRLFGDRWQKPEGHQSHHGQHPQVPVYGKYEQPVQTVEVVRVEDDDRRKHRGHDKEDLESVKEEIIEAVKEVQSEKMTLEQVKPQHKPKPKWYMGGVLGISEYSADNVEGNGAAGFSVGTMTTHGVIVEGTFLYSNYYLDQWWTYDFFKEIDQYGYGLSVKYSPFIGNFRPYGGGHVAYTYRKYTDRTYDYCCGTSNRQDPRRQSGSYRYPTDEEVTSNSVDFGFLIGMDFIIGDAFVVGAEYKYSMNMFNKSDSDFINRGDLRAPGNAEPLEEVDYSVFGLTGKFLF